MGAEADCKVTLHRKAASGKARLEADVLEFRAPDFKLSIPFKAMTRVSVRGETLAVSFPDGDAAFRLGASASKWAEKILNPPSRLQKLGVKPEWTVSAIGVDDIQFLAELEDSVTTLSIGRLKKPSDAIFFGVNQARQLSRLEVLKAGLQPNGALWVIRPKGKTAIREQAVMAAGKAAGLVDVKVVRLTETHTAEKFVIPLASRSGRAIARAAKSG
jgi:hypothetical protein